MKNGNANHPQKGDRIAVDPIRNLKDIKAIVKLTESNPRDQLLFVMGINNGLRAGDLVKLKAKDVRYLKVGDHLQKVQPQQSCNHDAISFLSGQGGT